MVLPSITAVAPSATYSVPKSPPVVVRVAPFWSQKGLPMAPDETETSHPSWA